MKCKFPLKIMKYRQIWLYLPKMFLNNSVAFYLKSGRKSFKIFAFSDVRFYKKQQTFCLHSDENEVKTFTHISFVIRFLFVFCGNQISIPTKQNKTMQSCDFWKGKENKRKSNQHRKTFWSTICNNIIWQPFPKHPCQHLNEDETRQVLSFQISSKNNCQMRERINATLKQIRKVKTLRIRKRATQRNPFHPFSSFLSKLFVRSDKGKLENLVGKSPRNLHKNKLQQLSMQIRCLFNKTFLFFASKNSRPFLTSICRY